MNLFKRATKASSQSNFAEIALNSIHDGVIMTDKNVKIEFINPAAATMIEAGTPEKAIGLALDSVIKLESKEGRELPEAENPLIQSVKTNQLLERFVAVLIAPQSNKRIPVAISVLPVGDAQKTRIITMRNVVKELEEEGEQAEFISTASHEMRTPVATIDGYLSLCLNPQTATVDERAKGYLTAAQAASKHLGKLFQDLLDVTKLDDGRIRPHFEPVEMVETVKTIASDHLEKAKELGINFSIGTETNAPANRRLNQVVYGSVDINFMREILDNLLDNALKYTPAGGAVYVNVRGDGDRVLINVTDTGMGISADDLSHIFQKFYRADNSDTRTIGGTGLGLYLVKQRAEAMGGKVWAESAFGEGSTFYVSLPRLTSDEYEKRMIAVRSQQMQEQLMRQATPATPPQPVMQPISSPVSSVAQATPAAQTLSTTQPASSVVQPAMQPIPPSAPVPPPPPPAAVAPPNPNPNQTPPTPSNNPPNNNNLNGEVK